MSLTNMKTTIKDLKEIIKNIPDSISDDTPVIVPVADSCDCNTVLPTRYARTDGVSERVQEKDKLVLCFSSAGFAYFSYELYRLLDEKSRKIVSEIAAEYPYSISSVSEIYVSCGCDETKTRRILYSRVLNGI